MAKKWVEVASSPAYQALAPEQQEEARSQYWNEVVAPKVPVGEQAAVRQQFDSDTSRTVNWPNQEATEINIVGGKPESRPEAVRPAANDSAFARLVSGGEPVPLTVSQGLGAGLRSVIQGAGGLIGSIGGDAANHYLVPGQQPTYREAATALADRLDLPKPQTKQERILGDVGEALTGTGLTMGVGGGINALAKLGRSAAMPATNRLAALLTAQPAQQALASGLGAAAASSIRESGGGTGAQIAGGLAAGLAPGGLSGLASLATTNRMAATGAIPTVVAGATRRALRGTDTERPMNMLADFAAAGTNPSVGQATGSRTAQSLETYLANTPGGSGQMARLAENQADRARSLTDELSNRLSPGGADLTPTQVGNTIQKQIYGPDGFVGRTKVVSDRLYSALDQLVPPSTRVSVQNTAQALRALNGTMDGAPAVSKFFQNARLQGIERGLLEDTQGGAAGLNLPGARQEIEAYRTSLQQQAQQAAARNAQRRSLGMNNFEPVASTDQIEKAVAESVSRRADGNLPYEAVQRLRSLVGMEVDGALFGGDIPQKKWRALYSALSSDMEAAASTPQARQALQRANNYFKLRMRRLEQLESVVNKNGGPEAAYQAMFQGSRNGATPLRRVMDSLPPSGRADVTASFLQRMGRATKGQQDATADAFSMSTFLTNWADLSPEARATLFSNARYGSDFVRNVDQLARVASAIRTGGRAFANPSGSAGQAALGVQLGGTGLLAGQQAMQGNLTEAAMVVASSLGMAGTNNVLARLMTNPSAVRWLARNTQRDTGDVLGQLQVLRSIGESEDDPEIVDLADRLKGGSAAR